MNIVVSSLQWPNICFLSLLGKNLPNLETSWYRLKMAELRWLQSYIWTIGYLTGQPETYEELMKLIHEVNYYDHSCYSLFSCLEYTNMVSTFQPLLHAFSTGAHYEIKVLLTLFQIFQKNHSQCYFVHFLKKVRSI